MKDFSEWYKELCSDVRWFEVTCMNHKGKNFKQAAEFVYAQLVADPVLANRSMIENRKHVYNRLIRMDYDRVFPQLQQPVKEEKKEHEEPPLTGEAREKKLKEWLEVVNNAPVAYAPPKLTSQQIKEEGDWVAKKVPPYPSTSPEQVAKMILHHEYVKENYNLITGDPLESWMPEDQWIELQKA